MTRFPRRTARPAREARGERRRARRVGRARAEMRFLAAGPAGYPFISRRRG